MAMLARWRSPGRMPRLFSLDLRGTRITEAGLPHLARSTTLHAVDPEDTAVESEAAVELSQNLANRQ